MLHSGEIFASRFFNGGAQHEHDSHVQFTARRSPPSSASVWELKPFYMKTFIRVIMRDVGSDCATVETLSQIAGGALTLQTSSGITESWGNEKPPSLARRR
jgi:hypothetical protein